MTFHISSALATQTASKTAALEILQKLGNRPANLTDSQFLKHHQHTTIEHWWMGVRVVIAPFWETGRSIIEATFHKGLSTVISWKEFAQRLWERANQKAAHLKTYRISETRIKVEGSQAPGGWWTVTATQTGLECNCHLYKCEHNRLMRGSLVEVTEDGYKEISKNSPQPLKTAIIQEAVPLLKALSLNKSQVKEFFNDETGKVEPEVQICCHHIIAAMWNEFDADNLSDYLLNYAEITNAWKQRNRSWGKLSFNVPAPKPEVPIGSYLQRTDDWMSLEYRVWIYCRKTRLEQDEIPWTTKGIGRIVEVKGGVSAYRPNSGIGQAFATKYDAIAYLIRNAGYTLEQVAEAFQLKQSA